MDLFDLASPVERFLVDKASALYQSIGGTMELTPLCNMDCKMCFVRLSPAQMAKEGRMLTCDQWLDIAREAKENGVIFLLLTGGEPLIFPEFKRLYTTLMQMGFIITINTNGTLINEEWADFFAASPCRRLNITLYGKDDDTYGELCQNPRGFTQVTQAIRLLRERDIPVRFNFSVTPENREELEDMFRIADELGVPIAPACYLFPPVRKPEEEKRDTRMTPEEAAAARLECFYRNHPGVPPEIIAKNSLEKLKEPPMISQLPGLNCRAGKSGFWMNWKGEMLPCGMFTAPKISLLDHSFAECWKFIVSESNKFVRCADCDVCELRQICTPCGAISLTETGSVSKKPEYLCRMTAECYRRLKNELDAEH